MTVATAAGGRSPASDGPRPKRRPRSPRTAAPRSQGCATAPYSGSCPTGCCASARRRRSRCPTWKRPPTAGPSPSGPARPTRWGTARCGSSGAPTVAAVQALPRSRRHHRWAVVPADPQGRPGQRRRAGRRLDPGDRPRARGITGRIGGHSLRVGARRRRRVPGRAPAGGRMALAHHAGGLRRDGGDLVAEGAPTQPWAGLTEHRIAHSAGSSWSRRMRSYNHSSASSMFANRISASPVGCPSVPRP